MKIEIKMEFWLTGKAAADDWLRPGELPSG